MDDALIGTWLLRSHRVEDSRTGASMEPFGSVPSGVLIVLADGRMVALITPGLPTDAAISDAAPAPLVAYSGHYRVPSPGRFVTAVDIAWVAPWVGTEQERAYTIAGDRLELKTVPQGEGDMAAMTATMVWVRETTAVASGETSD